MACMKVTNWNVNSIRTRLDRCLAFLERSDTDVALLQETKCTDAQFPYLAFEHIGYEVTHVGHSQWNGVAIVAKKSVGISEVMTSFPGQPGFDKDPDKPQAIEARAVGALCGGVRLWSLYVPNGRAVEDPHYDYKLRWLYALSSYVATSREDKVILGGDFNIAPEDSHVWDINQFAGLTHVTEPERQAFLMLQDSLGVSSPTTGFSYWDYKGARFPKNEGMLIDFQLARGLKATNSFIDVAERKGKGASDHAPVIVEYV